MSCARVPTYLYTVTTVTTVADIEHTGTTKVSIHNCFGKYFLERGHQLQLMNFGSSIFCENPYDLVMIIRSDPSHRSKPAVLITANEVQQQTSPVGNTVAKSMSSHQYLKYNFNSEATICHVPRQQIYLCLHKPTLCDIRDAEPTPRKRAVSEGTNRNGRRSPVRRCCAYHTLQQRT